MALCLLDLKKGEQNQLARLRHEAANFLNQLSPVSQFTHANGVKQSQYDHENQPPDRRSFQQIADQHAVIRIREADQQIETLKVATLNNS